ncbi:hypothetical protein SADUNF_Sadunf11G0016700 [Salix dunnii]|uniref:Uncharacterized protein n=1 Tax=Salix dunnii TaxID=1413687 RepID=A0A835JM16_9ROSI|nr:hypothetical protein SADUNF_Sadunf11G0016700 [Salix dunnii]
MQSSYPSEKQVIVTYSAKKINKNTVLDLGSSPSLSQVMFSASSVWFLRKSLRGNFDKTKAYGRNWQHGLNGYGKLPFKMLWLSRLPLAHFPEIDQKMRFIDFHALDVILLPA